MQRHVAPSSSFSEGPQIPSHIDYQARLFVAQGGNDGVINAMCRIRQLSMDKARSTLSEWQALAREVWKLPGSRSGAFEIICVMLKIESDEVRSALMNLIMEDNFLRLFDNSEQMCKVYDAKREISRTASESDFDRLVDKLMLKLDSLYCSTEIRNQALAAFTGCRQQSLNESPVAYARRFSAAHDMFSSAYQVEMDDEDLRDLLQIFKAGLTCPRSISASNEVSWKHPSILDVVEFSEYMEDVLSMYTEKGPGVSNDNSLSVDGGGAECKASGVKAALDVTPSTSCGESPIANSLEDVRTPATMQRGTTRSPDLSVSAASSGVISRNRGASALERHKPNQVPFQTSTHSVVTSAQEEFMAHAPNVEQAVYKILQESIDDKLCGVKHWKALVEAVRNLSGGVEEALPHLRLSLDIASDDVYDKLCKLIRAKDGLEMSSNLIKMQKAFQYREIEHQNQCEGNMEEQVHVWRQRLESFIAIQDKDKYKLDLSSDPLGYYQQRGRFKDMMMRANITGPGQFGIYLERLLSPAIYAKVLISGTPPSNVEELMATLDREYGKWDAQENTYQRVKMCRQGPLEAMPEFTERFNKLYQVYAEVAERSDKEKGYYKDWLWAYNSSLTCPIAKSTFNLVRIDNPQVVEIREFVRLALIEYDRQKAQRSIYDQQYPQYQSPEVPAISKPAVAPGSKPTGAPLKPLLNTVSQHDIHKYRVTCLRCGRPGHKSLNCHHGLKPGNCKVCGKPECPRNCTPPSAVCRRCGARGHSVDACPARIRMANLVYVAHGSPSAPKQ